MFTKNIKTISILALVAVIVLVASVLIAVVNDSNINDDLNAKLEDTTKSYEQKIAELNKIIEDLEAGLTDAETALKKLEENGIKLDSWIAATKVVAEKLEKLDEIVDEFYGKYENDELGVNIYDYFDEETIDEFNELYLDAYIAIIRATSVDSMDEIISSIETKIDGLKSVIDILDDKLTELEKDPITGDDRDAIFDAKDYFENINDELLTENQKNNFASRIDALIDAYNKVVVESFIAKVNALPTVAQLTGSDEHKAALQEVSDIFAYILLNNIDVEENEEFTTAGEKFSALLQRSWEIDLIVEAANAVNALIDAEADTTFIADLESAATIKALREAVKAWEEEYYIVTDTEADDYNEWIHNLVKYDTLAGYEKTFETATAELKAAADKYIAAVNEFGKIGLDSEKGLDELLYLYKDLFGTLNPEDVDNILAVAKKEESVLSAWNQYLALRKSYDTLVETIEFINDTITAEDLSDVNFRLIDARIAFVMGTYELDETAFDEDGLKAYKTARLGEYVETALANALEAYETSDNVLREQAYAALKKLIENDAAGAYTLTVKKVTYGMAIDNPDDLGYFFIIDNTATTSVVKSLSLYTLEYCQGFFAQFGA